jgi:hypothetical protein
MGELSLVNVNKKLLLIKIIAKLTIKQLKCTFTGRGWVLLTSSK